MSPAELPIRAALPREAAAIRELVRAAYAKWVPVIGREPRPMQADYAAAMQVHTFHVIGAEAALCAVLEVEARPDHLWIENIAVRPDLQGHGFGRRLLAHAETLARTAGFAELKLLLNKRFEANRRLYESVGYAIEREEPFMDGFTLYMRKQLD